MKEYIFQKGLPESLTKKGIVINDSSMIYAWRFDDTTQLFEWLTKGDYVVLFVGVFEVTNGIPHFLDESWIHIGDRSKDLGQSKRVNRMAASAFIERMHMNGDRLLFEVLFESTKQWDEIRQEFFNREINRGGELAYFPQDSLDVIERCCQLGKRILGLEAFIINESFIQPQDYVAYAPRSEGGTANGGRWQEATQFVLERADRGWVFEISREE
jgi:hypothetical protein